MGIWKFHFRPYLAPNFSKPRVPMSPIFGTVEDALDLYGLTDFEENLFRQFWENCDQSTGKIKIAEIVVRGTMFDSAYPGRQSRYSKYFTVVDTPSTCLQGDQKSSVYGWKYPHYRRSNLWDRSKLSCKGPCLTPHILEPWSQNFKILQQSIELFAYIRYVRNNENRFVGS